MLKPGLHHKHDINNKCLAAECLKIDNPNQELMNAASFGNTDDVKILLQCHRTDVNWANNHTSQTPLISVARSGQTKIVELLLQHHQIDINKVSKTGGTALLNACWDGNTEVVKLLLKQRNIEVNIADNLGRTALYMASKRGHPEIVRHLTEYSTIDVNTLRYYPEMEKYESSLWGAAERWRDSNYTSEKFLEIIKLLLDHPKILVTKEKLIADNEWPEVGELLFYKEIQYLSINQQLLVASVVGAVENVRMLLQENNTDINTMDGGGRTPLLWASKNGHSDIVKLLLGHKEVNVNKARDSDGENALLLASYNGHSEIVEQLKNASDIEINHVDSLGRTALLIASQVGQLKVAQLLLENPQIDINKAEPKFGETPLYMGSKNDHLSIVIQLLESAKINVNKATINRETALMVACRVGHSEIVDNLLRHPAIDVNFAAFGGKSAIFNSFHESTAPESKQQEIVRLMLRCPSVYLLLRDEEGNTALDLATNSNRKDIEEIFRVQFKLKQKGHTCCSEHVNDGLQIAAEDGDLKMVTAFLLCNNVNLNLGYKYGITPLFVASKKNHTEVVKLLLTDSRTDVNIIVNNDNALFIASEKGYLKIVTLLLAHHNIDVNRINTRNRKNSLIISSEKGNLEIVRALLNNPQTFVNEIDLYGMFALRVASLKGYLGIVKILFRCPKTNVSMIEAVDYGPDIEQALTLHSKLTKIGLTCCQNFKDSLLDAAWLGDFRAIKGQLKCPDVDVDVIDTSGRTPLYIASWKGHVEAVVVLLATDFNDIGKKINGGTPFSIASEKHHSIIMKQLIKNGISNVNKGWCMDNWTPSISICEPINPSNNIPAPASNLTVGE